YSTRILETADGPFRKSLSRNTPHRSPARPAVCVSAHQTDPTANTPGKNTRSQIELNSKNRIDIATRLIKDAGIATAPIVEEKGRRSMKPPITNAFTNSRKSLASALSPMRADMRQTKFGWSLELSPMLASDAFNALCVGDPSLHAGRTLLVQIEQNAWKDSTG